MQVKKLNKTAVGIFTDSEEETDKIIKKLKDMFEENDR